MSWLDTLRGGTVANMSEAADPTTALQETLHAERETNQLLEESIADLELAVEDSGWRRLQAEGQAEFTHAGLLRIAGLCRLMAIKNPLIKRAIALRTAYVWGGSVEVAARATGDGGEQDVNTVVQDFLDDPATQAALMGQAAQQQKEAALATDGNVFLALFTHPRTGRVQLRTVPFDEVDQVISNPEDKDERWYYKRTWAQTAFNPATGGQSTVRRIDYYPDVTYSPRLKVQQINGGKVHWDSPVLHVRVGGLEGWTFGVPDAYAAVDWARAYKDFLEDWIRLVKALSRFAWRTTTKGSKMKAVARTVATPPGAAEWTAGTQLDRSGATAVLSPDTSLEAIPKTGATIDSMSGKPVAMMVASAMDVPVTMLLADPGNVGARAVAETLDRPTELGMSMRREVWAAAIRTILGYLIDQSVLAPQGPLKGTVTRDEFDRQKVELADDTDRTIEVGWPNLDQTSPLVHVQAIATADQTGKMPPKTIALLLMQALGVEEADELIEDMVDDQGNWVSPDVSAGQAAADAFRRGNDPAAMLNPADPAAAVAYRANPGAAAADPVPATAAYQAGTTGK